MQIGIDSFAAAISGPATGLNAQQEATKTAKKGRVEAIGRATGLDCADNAAARHLNGAGNVFCAKLPSARQPKCHSIGHNAPPSKAFQGR
jgi:hypothetical protein